MTGRGVAGACVLLGALALGYSPIRALIARSAADEVPLLRVSRSTITDAAVALGTIRPSVGAEVKVGSQLSGVVEELRVNVGDRVNRGDLLASLRDADWRARVDVLRAQLASAVAERDFAAGDFARRERLGEILPQQDLEDARRKVRVTAAQVEKARADLQQAEIMLGYTVIRAPVSGTIGSVSTYRGETIAASLAAPTFVTIVDLDLLEVQAYVDENDIGRVGTGQRVSFRVDAFPGRELEGIVEAIYPKAQLVNNVVNYVVIIGIADRRGLALRPEMTVHVSFILEERRDVLTVPRSALMRRDGRSWALVKTGEGWMERPVVTGLGTPASIEIASGLSAGETIVADRQAWRERKEKSGDRAE